MLSRRTLLKKSVEASAYVTLASCLPSSADGPISLKLKRTALEPVRVPRNFIGLGYEMSSVAIPGLLSASNERYVRLIRGLGSDGVLRVGGIVSDYTRYSDAGTAQAEPKNTCITRQSLEQFDGLLRSVGWTAIWSLNFAQGTLENAVIEARAVASVLGPRLLAFEIGNEVENYSRGEKPFRTAPYTFDRYLAEYNHWRSAILQSVPGVSFAAPDTASSVEWVERMATVAKDEVQLLTTHYYRGGQKEASADQLLRSDARLKNIVERLHEASVKSGIPWRMCETNSFFGGGRSGISDTFVAALWVLDFMLFLAANGCAGVNIETGVNQLGFISSYSPINVDKTGLNRAGAPYYGMLAFATAKHDCTEIAPVPVSELAGRISAYRFSSGGKSRSAVLINRAQYDLGVSVADLGLVRGRAMRLIAPAPESVEGITFGGAGVQEDGSWAEKETQPVDGRQVIVPRMSAVVLLNDV